MFDYSGTYTDQYELAMAQVYFKCGRKDDQAVFDYFFRKTPFKSGYVVFAGLADLLKILESLHFTKEDIAFLRKQKHDEEFLDYLKTFRFKGNVYSPDEGDVVFPYEPVIRIEGNIIEAQIVETLLLNIINFESLIATKASRVRTVAKNRTLLEFGLRRAQGPGGYYASRAALIGGFDSTSHVRAAMDLGMSASGTMAHSFIQSEKSELEAFQKFALYRPEDCVLLLDTYSTLESGLPNAIIVAKEMQKHGQKLKGVRLDSGDLTYLSKACRKALDDAGLNDVKIIASNQLDEEVVESLLQQEAPIDIFGVGTKLVTGHPDAALDGVYKLSEVDGQPKLKLSESVSKISLPHKKQVWRMLDDSGNFLGVDAIALEGEKNFDRIFHPQEQMTFLDTAAYQKEALLKLQMENGKIARPSPDIWSIKTYARDRFALLPEEYKRFANPHVYKVGLTEKLKNIRDQLVEKYKSHKDHPNDQSTHHYGPAKRFSSRGSTGGPQERSHH